jgi:HlyD family secretion protein
LLAKPGDKVTVGQKLAQLESRSLQSQIADARARLKKAQADYDKIIAGASSQDIQVSEDTVAQKRQAVTAAENDLATLSSTRETELNNLKDTSITVFNNEIISAQTALDKIDDTLKDDKILVNLPAKDTNLLSQAQLNESQSIISLSTDRNQSLTLNNNSANLTTINSLDHLKVTLNLISTTLTQTLSVLNVTLTSSALTETEIETLKTNIRTQQASVSTAINSLQTAKTNWTNRIVYFDDQIKNAEDAVANNKTALQIAESQLNLKASPPRQFEINAAQALKDQAQAALSLAAAKLNEAVITAPLNGTITKNNYELGEQTSLATPVIEMIGESKLQIEVDIPESDIAKVITGQQVEVTLDAFGDEEIFVGSVTFVDPAETVIQDVVYYKVNVQLDEQDERKKPGMTANVIIVSEEKPDVLYIPTRAIKASNGDKYVEVLENEEVIKKTVTVGLRGDQGTEIMSGLREGEMVITFVKEK